MTRSRLFGFGLGLVLALAPVSVALAHAVLVSSTPNPNGIFPPDDSPRRVRLTFSEEVAPAFSSIRVFNQSGEPVDNGDLQIADIGNTSLTVSLKPLKP